MAAGGPVLRWLETLRREWAFSVHGVGLSLGSADGISQDHLQRLKSVVDRYQPALVSEHVSFAVAGGHYLNQLVPLPYTEQALDLMCGHVDQVQEVLQRPLLMENPSRYFAWTQSTIPETEFLALLTYRTGCGLLLDVNNVYVSGSNLGLNPAAWLHDLAAHGVPVGEIHLAGHAVRETAQGVLLIDDYGSAVCPAVWELYRLAVDLFGPVPTLIEWDSEVPPLGVLVEQAALAHGIRDRQMHRRRPLAMFGREGADA